jgi:hypothetical protein
LDVEITSTNELKKILLKPTEVTIHWKAPEVALYTIGFFIQPFSGGKCIFWIFLKKLNPLGALVTHVLRHTFSNWSAL